MEIEFKPLTIRGKNYHPYHFNCDECGVELNENAKEISTNFGLIKSTKLLCAKCYIKSGITTCAACKTPIEDNRSVVALGKHWHVEVINLNTNFYTFLYTLFDHDFSILYV